MLSTRLLSPLRLLSGTSLIRFKCCMTNIQKRAIALQCITRIAPRIAARTLCLMAFAGLTACGSGSSGTIIENPNTSSGITGTDFVYQGPAVQTDDIQSFRVNLFDNLVGNDRCGSCHGVDEEPFFLERDNVNEAYSITLTDALVDLDNPSASRLVIRAAEGHNCWEPVASVCAEIITNYIESWANETGAVSNVVLLTAPDIKDPGATKTFPATVEESLFATTVYPLTTTYCSECHSETSETQQQPFIGSENIALAYENSRIAIDLQNPEKSRLVVRLGSEFHNCWSQSCGDNAEEMTAAIAAFSNDIDVTDVNAELVISKALTLTDGVIASSGGRVENNLVALYEFQTGEGSTAFDTSGIFPSMNLTLTDEVDWLSAWGIRINNGKAQASTSDSRKLYNTIASGAGGTGAYSIEAWVVPSNVTQEGPARIVSYSGGDEARNFTLGQTLYNYNFLNRSSLSDGNGQPFVSTPDAAEVLQATLQHVVAVYDPVEGRKIYVNGELVSETEAIPGGTLVNWDDSFAFVVGNEVSGNHLWQGSIRLLAIYSGAMPQENVIANHEAGVGQKYFLLFNVSDLTGLADAYIVFEAQQFDDYGYLFNAPFFTVLSGDGTSLPSIPIEGVRIGINGKEATQGQAFAKLKTAIDGSEYREGRQQLSSVGTVIAVENGPDVDEFFLTFDQIGNNAFSRTETTLFATESTVNTDESRIGIKTFEEIDASLSAMTRIPRTHPRITETFTKIKQQLPTEPNIDGFLSAHQMGITQLAVEYCSELTNAENNIREDYFPGFNFSAQATAAFSNRDLVIDPLVSALLGQTIDGKALDENPPEGEVEAELDNLITTLLNAGSADTRSIVTAVCAAATGSAMMLIQ